MREELNNEELIQLYDAVFTNINTQFELWITITFAVIIASYVAGHRLERELRYLIAALFRLRVHLMRSASRHNKIR